MRRKKYETNQGYSYLLLTIRNRLVPSLALEDEDAALAVVATPARVEIEAIPSRDPALGHKLPPPGPVDPVRLVGVEEDEAALLLDATRVEERDSHRVLGVLLPGVVELLHLREEPGDGACTHRLPEQQQPVLPGLDVGQLHRLGKRPVGIVQAQAGHQLPVTRFFRRIGTVHDAAAASAVDVTHAGLSM